MVFRELEELRIESIRDQLVAHGIDRNLLQVDYSGTEKPEEKKTAISQVQLETMGFGKVDKKDKK